MGTGDGRRLRMGSESVLGRRRLLRGNFPGLGTCILDTHGLKGQTLVGIKALLTVETLHELAGRFCDCPCNGGCIDFDRSPLGASLPVLVSALDTV